MTKRDFFRLLIKIFGVYSLIISVFTILSSGFSQFAYSEDYYFLLFPLGILAVVVFLSSLLIFNPDFIINWLNLDKGYDEDRIQFENFNSRNIFKLAIFIIGGFLIIDNLALFINESFSVFRDRASGVEYHFRNSYYLVISFLQIVLGYLLITNYKWVSNLIKADEKSNGIN